MEIERKYLINTIPTKEQLGEPIHITQAYIQTDPVLRIRKWNEQCFFTYKSSGLMSRQEEEFSISNEDFEKLFKKITGIPIIKTRYRMSYYDQSQKKYTIELDFFHGVLDSLILAEVEFDSEKESMDFAPPKWFRREVTFDGHFHNSYLSSLNETKAKEFLLNLSSYK